MGALTAWATPGDGGKSWPCLPSSKEIPRIQRIRIRPDCAMIRAGELLQSPIQHSANLSWRLVMPPQLWKSLKAYYATMILLCLAILWCFPAAAQNRGEGGVVRIKTQSGERIQLYKGSYALLIGVSQYEHWGDLVSVPGELAEVKAALEAQGFKVEPLLNPDSDSMKDTLSNFIMQYGYDPDNRLLIFFSGHGATRADGRMGYLVPRDAPEMRKDPAGFMRKAVSMSQIMTWCREMIAKHALFMFDSCFSGTIFESRGTADSTPPPISDYTAKPVRYFISAGGPKEPVPAHSSFTPSFVYGLKGEADLNRDGYITGTELGMYLHDKVLYYRTGQTPQFGKIRDSALDKGDFVFQLAGGPGDQGADPRQARIKQLLNEGDALFQRGKLTTPAGANALARYNQVLSLDPLNQRADVGLKRIIEQYTSWAEARIRAGDYVQAEQYLDRANQVREGDSRVMSLRDKLRQARASSAAAAPTPSAPQPQPAASKPVESGRVITNRLGMKFVLIQPGSFNMGSNNGNDDEKPVHRVTISKPFYMQTTEVTQAQWQAVMGGNPSSFKGDDRPVEMVRWHDVQEFIRKLNAQEGSNKYRLPTEAEWEYAARAGSTTAYSWGDDIDCSKAMYENDPGSSETKCVDYVRGRGLVPDSTAPVGSYAPNAWGLYDLHGNVWEWVQDRYGSYSSGSSTDPSGPSSGSERVNRGGGWTLTAGSCRSANRGRDDPGIRYSILGFRLARGL